MIAASMGTGRATGAGDRDRGTSGWIRAGRSPAAGLGARLVLVAAVLLATAGATAAEGEPFRTSSKDTIGLSQAQTLFLGVDEEAKGTVTRFTPVAYRAPSGKKARLRGLRAWTIDAKDEPTRLGTSDRAEPIRKKVDGALAKVEAKESKTYDPGITGRVRLSDLGMVVYLEGDSVLTRTGELTVPKTEALVPSVAKRLGLRCKGTVQTSMLRLAASTPWKSLALVLEVQCTPESPKHPPVRIRKLVVLDVSSLAQ